MSKRRKVRKQGRRQTETIDDVAFDEFERLVAFDAGIRRALEVVSLLDLMTNHSTLVPTVHRLEEIRAQRQAQFLAAHPARAT